jgi:hypothetical protein
LAFDSGKIVGHVSLAGNFIGLSWLADELFPHLNDQPNIASGTPIKATVSIIRSTALAEKSQLNIIRDERAEAADKGSAARTSAASLQPSTDVNLIDKKWLASATLNDIPESASDTPIETNIRIQSIELAGKSGSNIVRDGHAGTADQGGTAHAGAASPQPTANVNLTDKKWLSDATLNDMPETPDTPIETSMIPSIELAVKPQPDIVHDANAETADKGGVAHTSAASPQPTADINRIDEEWLAKATEELVLSYSVRIKRVSMKSTEHSRGGDQQLASFFWQHPFAS